MRVLQPDSGGGGELVALIRGDPSSGATPLVRLHSECLTGDALGSLRCDCGEQLQAALMAIGREPWGAVVYLRQEGRGIGLADKARAYALQDRGLDTVQANQALGLPVDARDYRQAARALRDLGMTRIRLLSNNPGKVAALRELGVEVVERAPLEVGAGPHNRGYLLTKARRMHHRLRQFDETGAPKALRRPRVTLHWAQTLDGRIATRTGDSRWVGGPPSLSLAHELRANHDAVLVGAGTVVADDPQLTVRLVPGPSPLRVVADARLRVPLTSRIFREPDAITLVATTRESDPHRRQALSEMGVGVLLLEEDHRGQVSLQQLMARLVELGVHRLLVEGGAQIITSLLALRLIDRLVVCIAPRISGAGLDAVGDLQLSRLADALQFEESSFTSLGRDLIFDGKLSRRD